MIEQVKEHVRMLLTEGHISAFLGLKDQSGNIFPYLYTGPEDLDAGFSIGDNIKPGDSRYPMAKILLSIMRSHKEGVFGVLVRGCDERALNELIRWNQLPTPEHVVRVGIACPAELAQDHECRQPYPDKVVAGEKAQPVSNASVKEIMDMNLTDRLAYWKEVFDRCIKCYGCRDVCPVCFCNVCSLEENLLIRTGDLPPENPMFHLTRAVHMAGRCIDCNLCTEVCPANIPLRTLYKKVAEIVLDQFQYVTGLPGDGKSPLNILGPDPGHTSAND